MAIRPATSRDIPAIHDIYVEAVLTTTATYDYEPRPLEDRITWFEDHRRAGLPIFVAEGHEGVIQGWSALSRFHDRHGYRFTVENSIYVGAAHQGRGHGKALLQALIQSGAECGYHCVVACIDAANDISVRLHASCGFEHVGHLRRVGYKFDRWLDVLYMQRFLQPPKPSPG